MRGDTVTIGVISFSPESAHDAVIASKTNIKLKNISLETLIIISFHIHSEINKKVVCFFIYTTLIPLLST